MNKQSHTIQSMTSQPRFCSALRQRAIVVRLCHLLLLLRLVSRQANAFPSPRITRGRPAGGVTRTTLRTISSRLFDPARSAPRFMSDKEEEEDAETTSGSTGIDTSLDSRLYKVRLSRAVGIDWGTDLSFSFVYVRDLEPTGAAAMSGEVRVGDQLCEATPVTSPSAGADDQQGAATTEPINLIGAPFDLVMSTFANLDKSVQELDLVFFRGTKEDLKSVCTGELAAPEPETITVTVVQNKGAADERVQTLTAPAGVNLRELLVENNINVYQSVTRWTNCKGKQLCGTCIVNVTQGSLFTNRKSMDEASTLRENPESYRLSCITFAYGDVLVETFPPIEAAQWTR